MEKVTSSADLGQLRGFYEYLESAVFLPFAAADLARANGRLMRSVASVAENVAAEFPGGSPSLRWSSTGQLLTLHGRTAWFGVCAGRLRHIQGPLCGFYFICLVWLFHLISSVVLYLSFVSRFSICSDFVSSLVLYLLL